MKRILLALFLLSMVGITAVFMFQTLSAGGLTVIEAQPAPRSLSAPVDTAVTIQFNQPISRSTILSSTVRVFGKWSGAKMGTFGFSDLDSTVTFTPTNPFSAGEMVMVILSGQIRAADSSPLSSGYSFQFWTESQPADLQFHYADTLDVRGTAGNHTQAYGGVATDFNNDGWLDMTIVNEVTADVRIFLNRADGSGLYNDFLQPPTPVNTQASPNEPSDFNLDGNADLAVVNISTNSISILMGQGDGTLVPQQELPVGAQPRGIAVLDVDADGDPDIVNTNSSANSGNGNLSILLNNGSGFFGLPTYFEGNGITEWALGAADMNEDGLLDLVIGTHAASNPQVIIWRGNGDGTFTFASAQSAGGRVWMMNISDVNGDGHDDVATANSNNSSGSILLGDGQGNLAAPVTTPTDPFTLATDLGDIDGDGDLDWATSSYSGDWNLFLNDGDGHFTHFRAFPPTDAASCALMADMDNNGTLDLALIDEVADEVQLMHNGLEMNSPTIAIAPTAVTATLLLNTAVTHTLTISNLGTLELDWTLHEMSCAVPSDVTWFSAAPVSGTVSADSNTAVSLVLDAAGLDAGSYNANFCLASNDPANPELTVPMMLTVLDSTPTIAVSPPMLTATLSADTAVTQTLSIGNTGSAILDWSVHETACNNPANVPWLTAVPISGSTNISATTAVSVTFNTAGLLPADYEANLCIASNDLLAPQVNVPIALSVKGEWWPIYLPVVLRPSG